MINTLPLKLAPLLAQDNLFRDISKGFQSQQSPPRSAGDLLLLLLAVAVGAAAVWGLSRVATRKEAGRPFHDPRSLFRALCRSHRLDRDQCRLLQKLARRNRLAQPAAVFLLPELLEAEINATEGAQRQPLQALRDVLFADLNTDDSASRNGAPCAEDLACPVALFDDVAVPSVMAVAD